MSTSERSYDIIIWGGTGVVGRLVSEHLAVSYKGQGIQWAIAGRNRNKLEDVRKELLQFDSEAKNIPIITADLSDLASLVDLAKQTKVVLAAVGPYATSGTPMVEACISAGTHYCDITGETPWVRKMIREYDEAARKKSVKIIHCAGFDSIPSDLGTFLVTDYIKKTYNRDTKKVIVMYESLDGPVSGASIISLIDALFNHNGEDTVVQKDAYGLDPPNSIRGPDKAESLWPGYSKYHKQWHIPFVMAPVNTRIVRRSNALLNHKYGKNFSYLEVQGVPNQVAAYMGSFLFAFIGVLISIPIIQKLLIRLSPKAGAMPDKSKIYNGSWTGSIVGVPEGDESGIVRAEVKSVAGDAGYWSTSSMFLEVGLALALQEDELKASDNLQSGVLTPATALGHVLLKRLNKRPELHSFKIVEP